MAAVCWLRLPRLAEEASAKCRYAWIETRILELAECFSVSVYAWAVAQATQYGPLKHDDSQEMTERFERAILGNPERLTELRKRLGSLSWFMNALNEPIARQANQEDGCTHGQSFRTPFF